ncbi:AAA family ATPase [Sinomicrobium oceani]|uniref:AAA family ATPase n=1 Tax=Sinomicrobium oceani TaxID=1150368 RepID=UPI00227D0FDC|nr:AAA family ATPase [Sinomicrobium oceani]
MSKTPLKNQIIDWIKGYDYWFQSAGNRLLEGESVTEELVISTYFLFKEDYDLKKKEADRGILNFNEVADNIENSESLLQLQAIKDIENVNALALGQSISINQNLTIIYGRNGTGKSGYIRLLNNAFNSRGDTQILPNVFEDTTKGEPCCKFTFQSGSSIFDLEFPTDRENIVFSQYSVFDSQTARVHLEQDNKLNFTPMGFEFFEKTLQLYEAVSTKLRDEIAANRPANDFEKHFVNENAIREEIINLGANTDVEKLKELGNYTEEDSKRLKVLIEEWKELTALDIPKRIIELQKLQTLLNEFTKRQQIILDTLKPSDIEHYKNLISTFHKLRELAKQEGIASLKEYEIEALGSNEWRDFIKASKSYTDAITKNSKNRTEYPTEMDNCLFCLQPLTEKETTLIKSYWTLLKSEAEAELNRVIERIREIEKKLKGLHPVKFDETTKLFEYINEVNEPLAVKWKEIVAATETARQGIILNLSNRSWETSVDGLAESIKDFDSISKLIKETSEDLMTKNPIKELEELEVQINFLKDKSLLSKLLDKILQFVASHKWAAKAEKCLSVFNTRSITTKQGELFSEHITEKYTSTFNNECEFLDAPKVVNIVQRNAKASTLRKLQVAGQIANNILSEGEQRAISLADFLTEVQLNPNNKGIFFDDPVTSQDHDRREKIAARLAELAKERQIVVFTHDIAFFIRLKIFAETRGVNHDCTTIRKAGDISGIISPDLPWIVQPVKQRIGTLKDRLVRLKKIEKEASEDEYFFAAKGWYILLREAWERSVEERLFKGVIERFSIGVQTLRLKKIVITNDLISQIEHGMTESSNWLHDAAAGLNPKPPDTNKAETDLKSLEEFAKKCVVA